MNMHHSRPVQVFKWVPDLDKEPTTNYSGVKVQPSKRVLDFVGDFHQYARSFEELSDGVGQYPVAIVERGDGTVCDYPLNMIQFIRED